MSKYGAYIHEHIKYATKNEIYEQVENATESEFRHVANRLFSTVNKRINRLKSTEGVVSPALRALSNKRNGNLHFSSRYSFDELKKEYAQAYAFYKTETGTLTGARSYTNKLKSLLGERINDKDYVNYVFDTMHSLSDRIPTLIAKGQIGTNDLLMMVIESTVDEESSFMDRTESERDAYISEQIEKIVNQVNSMVKDSVTAVDKGLKNAFNSLW